MSDKFELGSRFDPNANFKTVKIGAGSHVLEVELNEMQEMAYYRQQQFIKDYIGDGVMNVGNLSYKGGFLTIDNEIAVVGGNLIDITHLSVEILKGNHAYLKVWEEEISYNENIKYKGNAQEGRTVPNYLWDERINEETSRRIQIMYDLVTDNTDTSKNAVYLDLGYLGDDAFIQTASTKGHHQTKFTYSCNAMEGQTVIDFPRAYAFGKCTMLVFVDGTLLMPEDFTEVNSTCIRFNIELHEGQEIFCYAENYIKPLAGEGHAETHMWDGNDPLDITDLKDQEDLLDKLRGIVANIIVDGGGFGDLDTERDTVYSGGEFTDDADVLDPDLEEPTQEVREVEFQVVDNVFQYRYKGDTFWLDLVNFNNLINISGLSVDNEKLYVKDKSGSVIGDGVTFKPIVDTLTSESTDNPLSAKQGKVLNDKITNLSSTGVDTSQLEANLKTYIDEQLAKMWEVEV